MKKLPSTFLRNEKYPKLDPPRFHCGWVLKDTNCVFDVANELNIQPHVMECGQIVPKPEWVQGDLWMQDNAFAAIMKNLELKREPSLSTVICPGKTGGRARMISVVENTTIDDGEVCLTDTEKLRKYFGKYFDSDNGPMWYLDSYYFTWNSQRYYRK